MKKLKISMFLAASLLALFACTKVELNDQINSIPQNDGVLRIIVSGGPLSRLAKSTAATGDTVPIEGGNVYTFTYNSSVAMKTLQWNFSNNGTTSSEPMVSNRYERVFTISSVTLIGVDINGNAHQALIWLDNLPYVGGDPIIYRGKTLLSNGLYQQEFWIYKNGAYMTPLNYEIKGNITTPPWQTALIVPAADTNYRLENGQLYVMPVGENGHWIKVYLISPANFDVEAAPLIRVSPTLGEQWASFKRSKFVNASNYGLMRYYVDGNGDVTPSNGNNLLQPGLGGDNYLRFDLSGSNLIIYQNNEQSFNAISPWIQFKQNDSWATPLQASTVVTGFPNWSRYEVAFTALPLRARFGSNITNPVTNPNNTSSLFYDMIYKDLFISVSSTGLKK